MRQIAISSVLICTLLASSVVAQQQNSEAVSKQQALEREAKWLRTIRLEIVTFGETLSEPQPQQQFKSGEPVWAYIMASNDDSEAVAYGVSDADKYHQYFPQLIKDGQTAPYLSKVRKEIADETIPLRQKTIGIKIEPYQRGRIGALKLQDWYGPLTQGFYELTLQHSFRRGGSKLTSNTITFEVIAQAVPEAQSNNSFHRSGIGLSLIR